MAGEQPLVVLTRQLAEVIQRWRSGNEDLRQLDRYHYQAHFPVGPIDWLSKESGVSVRTLHRIVTVEYVTTNLSIADAILVALGQQHLLNTTMHVIPNPKWSLERWIAYMDQRGCLEI